MHTYRKISQDDGSYLYVVGFDTGQSEVSTGWRVISEFNTEGRAAGYASYLNGGDDEWWTGVSP